MKEKEKKALDRNQIFLEFLKNKDVASFLRLRGVIIV